MKGTTVSLLTDNLENLNNSPHVLSQLIDILIEEDATLPDQQEQRWSHLATCVPCQAFLGSYLLKVIEYDEAHGNAKGPVQELLIRLIQNMHEILQEDIPAYVEALEEQKEEVNKQFPQFSDHLQSCRDCQTAVQDLRSWLHQSSEIGWL
ncbi:MAG: hypothetical protein NVSMB49_27480 [Ktedonobacteraceae bacterium]